MSLYRLCVMPPKKRARVTKAGKQMKSQSTTFLVWCVISQWVTIITSCTQAKMMTVKQLELKGRRLKKPRRAQSQRLLRSTVTGWWSLSPRAASRTGSTWRYGARSVVKLETVSRLHLSWCVWFSFCSLGSRIWRRCLIRPAAGTASAIIR